MNNSNTFTFNDFAHNTADLQALPEAKLSTPFEAAALAVLATCEYENNPDECVNMLNSIKGPATLSPYQIQFLRDRLKGKGYVPRSYFAGSSVSNNYTPTLPLSITVTDNPYSYQNEGYATLFVKSSGADSPRQVVLRKKGEQWFLWEIMFLSDIRKPAEEDPWA
ncbi:MAG: hypothetical protein K6G11_09875 [Lachnospiraceae bacterium]|nr:hypothetical protein [Lachnospiraceae bacterium]